MKQEMKMILRINKALDAVKTAIETSLSEDEALDVLDAVQLLTDTGVNCNVDTDTYTIYRNAAIKAVTDVQVMCLPNFTSYTPMSQSVLANVQERLLVARQALLITLNQFNISSLAFEYKQGKNAEQLLNEKILQDLADLNLTAEFLLANYITWTAEGAPYSEELRIDTSDSEVDMQSIYDSCDNAFTSYAVNVLYDELDMTKLADLDVVTLKDVMEARIK